MASPVIGSLALEIFLPTSASLKDKRQVLRSLQQRLRDRFNLAVAEVDNQDLWQRATLLVVSVAARRDLLDRMFDSVLTEAEKTVPGEILSAERDYLS